MFKKFIKKHNKKIIAFIGVLATTICGVLGITKTYAYESDEVSYTLDIANITKYGTSDFEGSNDNLVWEKNNFSDYYSLILNIPLLETLIAPNNDLVLLCNLRIQRRSTTAGAWYDYTYNGTRNVYVKDGNNSYNILQSAIYFNTYTLQTNNSLINYYGFMVQKSNNTNITSDLSSINLDLSALFNNSNLYRVTIMNIDLVRQKDVVTLEYVNNYYGGIQAQLEQLQEDYEELENNYDTLQDNYTDLESNYNDLQDSYDSLESDYNELFSNNQNGIWSQLKSQVCFADNYGYFGYTRDELLQNGFINALDNNIIMDAYTRKPDATDFHTTLNFYRNDETSEATTFVPLNLLSFRVKSNVNYNSVSTFIRIEAMNLDNLEQGTIPTYNINITPQILQLFEYEITFDKIANYFNEINFNYYNALGFINVYWTKRASNDYITFTSLNDLYSTGYISGYQQGSREYVDRINNLESELTNMQLTINSLREQLNSSTNDYNLNNLIWTIGGTPFESFKHIWNVNFFGVNIADFILGFITTFIGLYIFKKFFF